MHHGPTRSLDWHADPLDLLLRWPIDRPLLMLHSGRAHPLWARWSMLTTPIGCWRYHGIDPHQPTGRGQWIGRATPDLPTPDRFTHRPFADLRSLLNSADPTALWCGYLGYDLGRWVEHLPHTPSSARDDRRHPIAQLGLCPGWLRYDHLERTWRAHGTWADDPARIPVTPRSPLTLDRPAVTRIDAPRPDLSPGDYRARVQRVIDYIAAGDVFQVNLAQRLTAAFDAQRPDLAARQIYLTLAHESPAWYGGLLEFHPTLPDSGVAGAASLGDARGEGPGIGDDSAIGASARVPSLALACVSPELFLRLTPDRRVLTRPIKGTRPASVPVEELRNSAKDAAELHMIVDLLRNDLGRVCGYGSIHVPEPRGIETHPTVHHGVATIGGLLHPGKDAVDLLRATFPGGSITGAPKVRAMQIIDELEPPRRGPYCGAVGWITRQAMELNIAIRTAIISVEPGGRSGRIDYSVGGGVVSDSRPDAELRETLDKAAPLLALARRLHAPL